MSENPFYLSGKTILITGASSGIGRAVAIQVSKFGASRCFLVARNTEALTETASLMEKSCEVIIYPCDLSDGQAIESLVNNIKSIDGVVLNAGINKIKPLQFYSKDDIESIFDINCFSSMLLTKQLAKKRCLNSPSSIVFTASISGFSNVSVGNGIYGASKSALSAFMKYAALELAPKGIRCNAVHPGRIETPLIHQVTDQEAIKKDTLIYPLKRYGTPEEVAYGIIYLLSDASAWTTGTNLIIDGGRSLV